MDRYARDLQIAANLVDEYIRIHRYGCGKRISSEFAAGMREAVKLITDTGCKRGLCVSGVKPEAVSYDIAFVESCLHDIGKED